MELMSWKDYLGRFVDAVRKNYDDEIQRLGIPAEDWENRIHLIREDYTFREPCQIEVFEFQPIHRIFWIIQFDESKPDKSFNIFEKIKEKPTDFAKTHERGGKYNSVFENAETVVEGFIAKGVAGYTIGKNWFAWCFSRDPRKTMSPEELAFQVFSEGAPVVLRQLYLQSSRRALHKSFFG
jgi:hypothetical protein